jgi:ankyrin repeat protein
MMFLSLLLNVEDMTHRFRASLGFASLCLGLSFFVGCGDDGAQEVLTHEVSNPLVEEGRWSALHAAVQEGNSAKLKDLLAAGVDVNVKAVAKDDYSATPLHLAAKRGDVVMAQMLMEKGADVNSEMTTGEMPLHTSVKAGHRAMVLFLLGKGADPNSESFYIQSPIAIAEEMNRQDLIDALRQ